MLKSDLLNGPSYIAIPTVAEKELDREARHHQSATGVIPQKVTVTLAERGRQMTTPSKQVWVIR